MEAIKLKKLNSFQFFNLKCLALYYSLLIYTTLAPFQHWQVPDYYLINNLLHGWLTKIFVFDIIQNILLYLPLGFLGVLSFVKIVYTKSSSTRIILIFIVLLASALVTSTSLELLQSYNPARTPSLLDVLMNTLGGLLGGIVAFLFKTQWMQLYKNISNIFVKKTTAFFGILTLLLWSEYQLAPFLPTLHPKRFIKGSAPLMHTARHLHLFDIKLGTLYFIVGILLGLSANACFKRHSLKLLLVFVIFVLFSKILIIGRSLSLEAVIGTVLGILCYTLFRGGYVTCRSSIHNR